MRAVMTSESKGQKRRSIERILRFCRSQQIARRRAARTECRLKGAEELVDRR